MFQRRNSNPIDIGRNNEFKNISTTKLNLTNVSSCYDKNIISQGI